MQVFGKDSRPLCLDGLILSIPTMALNWAIPYVGSILLALFYSPIFESSSMQATPGKYWMGLKVLNENGATLSFARAMGRHFLRFLSTVTLLIGYLIQPFTAKRQALHDILANSVVIEHQYNESPDWIKVWINQMRYILHMDTDPTQITNVNISRAPEVNAVDAIEKLYTLYKNGALTEEEFQNKKAELLKQV